MRSIVLDTKPPASTQVSATGSSNWAYRDPEPARHGNHFHRYINPERESEQGALKVHGITYEFLQDKPKFREIAAEFLDYIQGAELVIHNAAFDVEFLNLELGRLGLPPIETTVRGVVDSLKLAREAAPGKEKLPRRLCASRYEVDHAHRTLHGALLDRALSRRSIWP